MDYAWVSGVVVLVILAILLLGWLPRRTADSMKKVVEHREDKYSPSLHLVDAESGTRFSDERQPSAKGIVMQSERKDIVAGPAGASVARPTKATKERARVARIRRLRREAARRRAIISAVLLAVTIVVLAISFPLKFSPLFALIPAVLLALVVALGARTANHARAWERDLKAKRAARAKANQSQHDRSAAANNQAAKAGAQVADNNFAGSVSSDEQPTGLMAEQEIQKAMAQTKAEKERIESRRLKARAKTGQNAAKSSKPESRARSEKAAEVSRHVVKDVKVAKSERAAKRQEGKARAAAQVKSQRQSPSASASGAKAKTGDVSASAKKAPKAFKPSSKRRPNAAKAAQGSGSLDSATKNRTVEASDATNELKQVHPAQALDLVDLAPNQDLISFSLGAPRNGVEVKSEEPQSLEIKSTRQVAKAKVAAKDEDASSSAAKRTEKSADRSSEAKQEDPGSSLSSSAAVESVVAQAKGSAGKLISKKNRKRVRAAAKRMRAAAQRNGRAAEEKTSYTSDPEKFHASEVSADTEAPALSSDSLGTGLEKILERRNV